MASPSVVASFFLALLAICQVSTALENPQEYVVLKPKAHLSENFEGQARSIGGSSTNSRAGTGGFLHLIRALQDAGRRAEEANDGDEIEGGRSNDNLEIEAVNKDDIPTEEYEVEDDILKEEDYKGLILRENIPGPIDRDATTLVEDPDELKNVSVSHSYSVVSVSFSSSEKSDLQGNSPDSGSPYRQNAENLQSDLQHDSPDSGNPYLRNAENLHDEHHGSSVSEIGENFREPKSILASRKIHGVPPTVAVYIKKEEGPEQYGSDHEIKSETENSTTEQNNKPKAILTFSQSSSIRENPFDFIRSITPTTTLSPSPTTSVATTVTTLPEDDYEEPFSTTIRTQRRKYIFPSDRKHVKIPESVIHVDLRKMMKEFNITEREIMEEDSLSPEEPSSPILPLNNKPAFIDTDLEVPSLNFGESEEDAEETEYDRDESLELLLRIKESDNRRSNFGDRTPKGLLQETNQGSLRRGSQPLDPSSFIPSSRFERDNVIIGEDHNNVSASRLLLNASQVIGIVIGALVFILIGTFGFAYFVFQDRFKFIRNYHSNKTHRSALGLGNSALVDNLSSHSGISGYESTSSSIRAGSAATTRSGCQSRAETLLDVPFDCVSFDFPREMNVNEETYNLDNDSFLNSLETITVNSGWSASPGNDSDV